MKNYIRKEKNFNDTDQNEQQLAISYNEEEEGGGGGGGLNYAKRGSMNRSAPITQPPLRNNYDEPTLPTRNFHMGGGGGHNSMPRSNFQQQGYPQHQQQQQQPYTQQPQQQQQQQQQQPPDMTPIYVPPFLLNQMRQQQLQQNRHHHNHNAPSDYLPWSIANIFICVIFAMPALFFSVQTRDMKRAGDIKKAKVNARRSLYFNIAASIIGLLTILSAVILRFAVYQLIVNNDVNAQNVPIIAGG